MAGSPSNICLSIAAGSSPLFALSHTSPFRHENQSCCVRSQFLVVAGSHSALLLHCSRAPTNSLDGRKPRSSSEIHASQHWTWIKTLSASAHSIQSDSLRFPPNFWASFLDLGGSAPQRMKRRLKRRDNVLLGQCFLGYVVSRL